MSHICRTCLSQITNSCYIDIHQNPFVKRQLTLCIPELALGIVADPIICMECTGALDAAYNFRSCCLRTEERILAYMQSKAVEVDDLKLAAVLGDNSEIANDIKVETTDFSVVSIKQEFKNELSSIEIQPLLQSDGNDASTEVSLLKPENCVQLEEYSSNVEVGINTESSGLAQHSDKSLYMGYFAKIESNDAIETEADFKTIVEEPFLHASLVNNERFLEQDKNQEAAADILQECKVIVQESSMKRRQYKCGNCDYVTVKKDHLIRHAMTHTGKKPYKCNHCNFSTVQHSNFKKHIMLHTGEKPFTCSLCNYATTHKTLLNSHIMAHNGERPFKCNVCDYATTKKDSLIKHVMIHGGEKPFKCNQCNYSTVQKANLKRHVMLHTGEKPFTCSMCSYATTRKSLLNSHVMAHTGERPFKCSICDYATTRKNHLIKHAKTHSREKSYKCKRCDYVSTQRSDLKTHEMTHTENILSVTSPIL